METGGVKGLILEGPVEKKMETTIHDSGFNGKEGGKLGRTAG